MQLPQWKRREVITLLGSTAAAWPIVASAQTQLSIPVIGFLSSASPAAFAHLAEAFRDGLNRSGYVEGRTLAIEYRWAEGQFARLPTLATDLVQRRVAAIVATGGEPAALAAKGVTPTIPIVFLIGDDPVSAGLVASFNRPGGNATGLTLYAYAATAKRLGLLRELVPTAPEIAVLINPTSRIAELELQSLHAAASSSGEKIQILHASTESGIDAAFMSLVHGGHRTLLVSGDPLFTNRRYQLTALATRHALIAIYAWREYPLAGGLMSYGASLADAYRQVGGYTGRILKGEKPADLPVLQPTKFELVINLATAKALGLEVPPTLLARADEVIE
jgi:putative ABC transport system substrate-binding protein